MNIFLLDPDHETNCKYHCDKHVVKMITEYNQLMSTACHIELPDNVIDKSTIYRKTHYNHPCAIWVRKSKQNFRYILDLNYALCMEYTYRYKKVHKGQSLIKIFEGVWDKFDDIGLTEFPKCMPEEYKVECPYQSYINYYNGDKQHIAKWKNRDVPSWFIAAS